MGYRFKVKIKVERPTVMLAGFATPHVSGCTQFFLGWTRRLGNPPYLFYVPLERQSTQSS
jgi:hypothetical protein